MYGLCMSYLSLKKGPFIKNGSPGLSDKLQVLFIEVFQFLELLCLLDGSLEISFVLIGFEQGFGKALLYIIYCDKLDDRAFQVIMECFRIPEGEAKPVQLLFLFFVSGNTYETIWAG